jgi:hypothetical protein
MEQWHISLDTKEAAAFAALGATVKIVSSTHQRTSTREVRFHISPHTEPEAWNVGQIRKSVRDKSLFTAAPAHPYLTIHRAFHARECILDMQNKGARFRLLPVPGAAGIFQHAPSDTGLPGTRPGDAVVRTRDLKMAAALTTCGFPLLTITGSGRQHEYTLAAYQIPASAISAVQLLSDWSADASAMPFALPFVQAATGLLFREQLRTEVSRAIDTVLISKPRTTSHAAIRADAAPRAWDKVANFFNGTR